MREDSSHINIHLWKQLTELNYIIFWKWKCALHPAYVYALLGQIKILENYMPYLHKWERVSFNLHNRWYHWRLWRLARHAYYIWHDGIWAIFFLVYLISHISQPLRRSRMLVRDSMVGPVPVSMCKMFYMNPIVPALPSVDAKHFQNVSSSKTFALSAWFRLPKRCVLLDISFVLWHSVFFGEHNAHWTSSRWMSIFHCGRVCILDEINARKRQTRKRGE